MLINYCITGFNPLPTTIPPTLSQLEACLTVLRVLHRPRMSLIASFTHIAHPIRWDHSGAIRPSNYLALFCWGYPLCALNGKIVEYLTYFLDLLIKIQVFENFATIPTILWSIWLSNPVSPITLDTTTSVKMNRLPHLPTYDRLILFMHVGTSEFWGCRVLECLI